MRRRALATLLAAVILAACDSRTPSPHPGTAAPASSDLTSPSGALPATSTPPVTTIEQTPACNLLFEAEVADTIGTRIGDAQELPATDEGTDWLRDCIYWHHPAHDESAPFELEVGSGARYVAVFDDISGLDGVSPVAGFGDHAFIRMATIPSLDGPVGSLYIRSGQVVLQLTLGIVGLRDDDGTPLVAGDEAAQTRILTTLAGLAWRRLTGPPEVSAKTCELLSVGDAGALVGMTFAQAVDIDPHDIWGPSCRYLDATGPNANERWIDLWVGVSKTAAAGAHFDACRAEGAIVPGLGDVAFMAKPGNAKCEVKIGFNFQSSPLVVKTGDTVIAVGDGGRGSFGGPDRADKLVAVARALLAKLGGVSVTPPPVNADALVHPCALLTASEVGGIVGATITEPAEWSADASGNHAQCYYGTSSSSITPLTVTLGKGTPALNDFTANVQRDPTFTPVAGLGDEAFQRGTVNETDQPLLAVVVRSGDLVVTLQFGPVRPSADFLSYVAPGTPEQQLEMARQLLGLLMPRVAGT